ncbi:MAG TPA: hypothetical protein VGS27_14115 [Candidatus Sulfotelmatobacter sp.]|nr:hypothetical protein [Candidatus Sulfotelmatobacter sp.]
MNFRFDAAPPQINIVSAKLLTPDGAGGRIIQLAISGRIASLMSGVDPTSTMFIVRDEDGIPQTSGSIVVAKDGTFSFRVSFERTRSPRDEKGRDRKESEITVSAKDHSGNQGSASALMVRERGDLDGEARPKDSHHDESGR